MISLFSMNFVAKTLGITQPTMWRWVYVDRILPAPTHQKGQRLCYSLEDVEGFKRMKAQYEKDREKLLK